MKNNKKYTKEDQIFIKKYLRAVSFCATPEIARFKSIKKVKLRLDTEADIDRFNRPFDDIESIIENPLEHLPRSREIIASRNKFFTKDTNDDVNEDITFDLILDSSCDLKDAQDDNSDAYIIDQASSSCCIFGYISQFFSI